MYGCTNYGYSNSSVSPWVHDMCNNTAIGSVEHVGGAVVSLYFVSFILLASLVMMFATPTPTPNPLTP